MDILTICISSATALFAGIIASISGGGALVVMPLLLLLGVSPHATLGALKFSGSLGALSAAISYAVQKKITWRLALPGSLAICLGASCGSMLTLWLDPAMLGKSMLYLLPVGLLLTMLPSDRKINPAAELSSRQCWIHAPLIIFACGVYDGFFGPGTGTFLILGMNSLLRLDILQACGTGRFLVTVSNLSAMTVFIASGTVIYELAIPMTIASIIGNLLGTRLAIRGGTKIVRRVMFGTVILLFGNLFYMYMR